MSLNRGDRATLQRLAEVDVLARSAGQFVSSAEYSTALSLMNRATRREDW